MKTESFFAMVAGTAFGVAIGLLFAPDKGSETRRKVRETATGLYADATDSLDGLKDSALKSTSRLRARARIAGRELRGLMDTLSEQGQSLNAYQMGSTLAALFWCGNKLWVCNIGDSRVFGLHGRHLLQLSVDHTDEAFLRERGITNRKPYLTQYLGMDPNEILLVPAIRNYRAAAGDRFLVCSDGVTDMLSAQEIETILRQEKTPENAAARLVQAALDNGGKDNITAIVCDILR